MDRYGPYTIPKKSEWVIVGSGPSAMNYLDLKNRVKDLGVVCINGTLDKLDYATVNIHSHYETVYNSNHHFDRAEVVFISDPLNVGFCCIEMDPKRLINLYSIEKKYPDKVRFWKKEISKNITSEDSLYAFHTTATAAVDLLVRNGVKKINFCGIDGGHGHSENFNDIAVYAKGRDYYEHNYDRARTDLIEFSLFKKVELIELKKGESQ